MVTERGKEEDKSHTWWAVPAGTQASACSQERRWSPAWVAFPIPSDDRPLSSSFSVRSGRERASRSPDPAEPAGLSPGVGGENESHRPILLGFCKRVCVKSTIAHLFLQVLLLLHKLLHLLHGLLEVELQHGALLFNLYNPALRSHPLWGLLGHLLLHRWRKNNIYEFSMFKRCFWSPLTPY